MDKSTTQLLVRETFKASFDKKRYRDFINQLCNGIDESEVIPSMAVPDAFAPHIKAASGSARLNYRKVNWRTCSPCNSPNPTSWSAPAPSSPA